MSRVSGKVLADSINKILEDKELTDTQKLRRIKLALDVYEIMN